MTLDEYIAAPLTLRTFTTTLSVIRSDGFVNRDASSGMPYFFEGRVGPYTRG